MAIEINQFANIQKSNLKIKGSDIPGVVPTLPNYSGETYSAYTENDVVAIGGFIGHDDWLLDRSFFVNTADKRLWLRTGDEITEFTFASDIYTTGTTLSGNTIIYDRNDGNTYQVDLTPVLSAGTLNYYTTGATLSGNVISFDRNDLSNAYSVDITPALSANTTGTGTTNYITAWKTSTELGNSNINILNNKYVGINTTAVDGFGIDLRLETETGATIVGTSTKVSNTSDGSSNTGQYIQVINTDETGQTQTNYGQQIYVDSQIGGADRGYGTQINVNNVAEGQCIEAQIGSYNEGSQIGGISLSINNYADNQVVDGQAINVQVNYPNVQARGMVINVQGTYASGATALVLNDGTQAEGKVWTARNGVSGEGYWAPTSISEVKTTTTGVTTGDTVVSQEIFGSDTGMDEYYYIAVNQANNAKTVGKLMSNRLTTTITYNDYGTTDIGDCSGISFRVEVEDLVRNNVVATVTNDTWNISVWHKRIY